MSSYSAGLTRPTTDAAHLRHRRPDHQATARPAEEVCDARKRLELLTAGLEEERGGGHYGRGHEQEPARRAEGEVELQRPTPRPRRAPAQAAANHQATARGTASRRIQASPGRSLASSVAAKVESSAKENATMPICRYCSSRR